MNIDLDSFDTISDDIVKRIQDKIKKIIKGRYEFYGYQKFANLIENIQRKIKEKYPPQDFNKYLNKKLKELFSDSVFIIDEVHNIKQSNDLKVLPPLLEKVVKNAINMKLLLLSATPMFDKSNEIIYLINLMLRNDNRPLIKANKYINSEGTLIESEKVDFIKKIRGYISYMRGEDPYRFPKRLYPQSKEVIKIEYMPNKDKNGDIIEDDMRIQHLNIVPCVMKDYQLSLYEKMEGTKSSGEFNQPAIMCSNIVFPKKDVDPMDPKYKLGDFISNVGFNNVIGMTKNGKDIKYNIIDDEYKDFFNLDVLSNYSTKIVKIVKNIEKSKGIVFVYSQYLNAGIIPLALALEQIGYTKYNGALTNSKTKTKGNYIIISGNVDLSSNAYAEYIKLQDSNKDGDKIKIIIGSQTAAEGLDFSYIREVHILEPWFHLNRLDQVIGRAIRNCSHIDLEPKDRNVIVYLYAAVKSLKPINENETIDLETYRKGEIKSKQMSKIEYVLKKSAVDCYFNKHGNYFGEDDIDYSKQCNYEACNYECDEGCEPDDISKLNYDTIDDTIIDDNIEFVKNKIIKLYKKDYYYTIDDFIEILELDPLLIFFALNKLLKFTGKIVDKKSNKGKIIYNNGYYIFVKKRSSKFVSINNIRVKSKKRLNSLNISRNNVLTKLKKNMGTKPHKKKLILKIKPELILKKFYKNDDMGKEPLYTSCKIRQIKDELRKMIYDPKHIESRYYLDFMNLDEKEKLTLYLIEKNIKKNILDEEQNIL